jgi:hypothetical protein
VSDSFVTIQTEKNNTVVLTVPQSLVVTETQLETVVSSGGYQGIQGPQGLQGIQGEPGPAGESGVVIVAPAGLNLSGHRAVVLNNLGEAIYADNNTVLHATKFAGITQGAVNTGSSATLQQFGEITEPTWTWTVDQPIYLGTNGLLTQTVPTAPSAKFSLIIGVAQSATKIFLNPMPPIFII